MKTLRSIRYGGCALLAASTFIGCSSPDSNTDAATKSQTQKSSPLDKKQTPVSTPQAKQAQPGDYVPDEIIVKFKDDAPGSAALATKPLSSRVQGLMKKRSELKHAEPLVRKGLRMRGGRAARALEKVQRLRFDRASGKTPLELAAELAQDPDVEWAEPNYLMQADAVPNDPSYATQRQHEVLNTAAAWDTTTGNANVVVAVIDTGVDMDHPDLVDNLWTNVNEIPDDGIDNDGNGYIDDVQGWDFIDVSSSVVYPGEDPGPPDNNPDDVEGHGTACAGNVAAVANNDIGVAGIAPGVKVMALRGGYKSSSGGGSMPNSATSDAIIYAADNGAQVITMSFGGSYQSSVSRLALEYAAEAGVTLIASAGNDNYDKLKYPAAYPNVIAVAALDYDEVRDDYSNYAGWIDISAPGSSTYTTHKDGGYAYFAGTSSSAPLVAGVAALIRSAHPSFNAQQVEAQLLGTARNIDAENPLYVGKLGAGVADAAAAVGPAVTTARLSPVDISFVDPDSDGHLERGEAVTLRVALQNYGAAASSVSVTLQSSDAFLTLGQNTVSFNGVASQNTIVAEFPLSVDAAAPNDHLASLQFNVNADGVQSTLNIEEPLQPTWRETSLDLLSLGSFDAIELADGGAVVAHLGRNTQTGISWLYTTSRNADGIWGEAMRMHSASRGCADPALGEASNGTVGLAYEYNAGSWNNDLYYREYNPVSQSWSGSQLVSSTAVVFDSNMGSYDDPSSTVFFDAQNRPRIVWIDGRSGTPQLYLAHKDSGSWQEQFLSDLAVPTLNTEPVLTAVRGSGDSVSIFVDEGSGATRTCNAIDATGLSFGAMHAVTCAPEASYGGNARPFERDGVIYQITADSADGAAIDLLKYQSGDWVFDRALGTNPVWLNAYGATRRLAADGSLRMVLADFGSTHSPFGFNWITTESGSQQHSVIVDRQGLRDWWPLFVADDSVVFSRDGFGPQHLGLFTKRDIDPSLVPSVPVVTDAGETMSNNANISASWTVNFAGTIDHYDVGIGTAPGLDDIVNWTFSTGLTRTLDTTYAGLVEGQRYFVSVIAVASTGARSAPGASDGIVYQTSCTPECAGLECGDDGCGGSCGSCGTDESCNTSGLCEAICVPACSGAECGDDGCGDVCGTCGSGLECNASGQCEGDSGSICDGVQDFAAAQEYPQGTQVVDDGRLWESTQIIYWSSNDCRPSAPASWCTGQWTELGTCSSVCTPNCSGLECGDDGCGGTCGSCDAGESCNAAQICEAVCTPDCSGKQCGDDGCGGTCGSCNAGENCNAAQICEAAGGGSCAGLSAWVSGASYNGGDQVQSGGSIYECKAWPYNGWCGAGAAYEPGVGAAWSDAWTLVAACN